MSTFAILLVLGVTVVPYLSEVSWAPAWAKFAPELVGGVALVAVLSLGVRNRFRFVRPQYWLVLAAVVTNMAMGVAVQTVGAGPVVAGIRTYLRAMPVLLLPGVYAVSDEQVRTLLKLLLAVCLIQLPLTIYQRMQLGVTGDAVSGTLLGSGLLSIFLICAACVVTAAYVRRRIGFVTYLLLLVLVLVPTTLNETKATIVLIPFGLALPFILGAPRGARFKNLIIMVTALAAFMAVFVPVYNWTQREVEYSTPIEKFFLDENRLDSYMETGAGLGAPKGKWVGRVDAIKVPAEYVAADPFRLVFGLGIGNASRSALGIKFDGQYGRLFEPFMQTSATRLLLETGALGLGLVVIVLAMIFRDALAVAQRDRGWLGVVALGWLGVTAVLTVSMFYADLIASSAISYLFWFFSGVISARRMQFALESPDGARRPVVETVAATRGVMARGR